MGSMVGEIATSDNTEKLHLIMSLTLWVGLVMTVLGICRAGALLDFIPKPVIKGFTAATGLITACSVSKDLLGIKVSKSPFLCVIRLAVH